VVVAVAGTVMLELSRLSDAVNGYTSLLMLGRPVWLFVRTDANDGSAEIARLLDIAELDNEVMDNIWQTVGYARY